MSYLDSQQQLATKVQMDWTSATSLFSALSVSTTWTDLTGTSQTFVVDDPTSVIEISVSGFVTATLAASVANVAVRVSIDNGAVVKPLGGCPPIGGTGVTGDANVLAGANLITVTGLSSGSHTVKLQAWADTATNLYCRPPFPPEFISIRVIERKVMPSIFSGQFPTTKVQLDWSLASDITGQSIPGTTWTDVTSNQNFTVDDPNSVVEIAVSGYAHCIPSTTLDASCRVVIDSAGTTINKIISTGAGSSSTHLNALAGVATVPITGLAAGTHTIKLQTYQDSASAQPLYIRPITQPNTEFLNIRVLERKQTAALVSNCLVKLAEVGVGALGQANIQFSNIPQTYRSLQIDVIGRCDAAASYEGLGVQFNGDTGANYYDVAVQSHAGSTGAGEDLGSTYSTVCFVSGASALANLASPSKIVVPNYTGTQFHKTCLGSNGIIVGHASGNNWAINGVGMWASTAAITSILLFPGSGNFVAGSVCSLYGIV